MKSDGRALHRGLIFVVLMILVIFPGFRQFATFMMRKDESNSYVAERYLVENYPGFPKQGGGLPRSTQKYMLR